jgi:ABC-2 type transport system ATP-binding protein
MEEYMNMNIVLEVENLKKQFGGFIAVDNISFSVKEGEILGFLGPNGAGKTTTIQMLLAVLTPSQGIIKYFGKDLLKHKEEILEKVNFSTTYTNLPWVLSVRENLTFISYLYEIPHRKKRVDEIIELFKLQKLEKKRMAELSAGQRTRVNLAKAFINQPKVLLLDEPTASLDPDIASYIRGIITDYRDRTKATILWTSHNMSEVEEMCDRVIFINKGQIISDDTPDKLAKSIEISHVELLVRDGMKRTEEYCNKNKLSYKLQHRTIIIDVKESKIAEFLRGLMDAGVIYDEISIEKPTLEDYFLQTAGNYENS